MRRSAALFAVLALGLPGCAAVGTAAAVAPVADAFAREAARGVVDAEVARRFPGVDASPVTDCVIEAAGAREIVALATAAAARDPDAATRVVGQVIARPAARDCLLREAPALLLGGATL